MPRTKKSAAVVNSGDGSPSAQITALSAEILKLTDHLKANPKDYSSRRGLLKKVGKRKSLLRYLQSNDTKEYKAVAEANGLRVQ
ncbi:MAG: 30S ribosomal protein S15 [Patescibacteria group bacterium]